MFSFCNHLQSDSLLFLFVWIQFLFLSYFQNFKSDHVDWLVGYTDHLLARPPCLGPIWWRHALAARGDCSLWAGGWNQWHFLWADWHLSQCLGAGHGHPFWHEPWHWTGVQAARCCLHCSEGQLTTERFWWQISPSTACMPCMTVRCR